MAGNVYTMTAASRVTVTRDRERRETRGAVGDPEVPQHRAQPADRERRDGRARRQSDHARAQELHGPQLRVRADRDHGRGREHPHAQPDHLRPGRDPLPSVRARRDGRREESRSRARARRVRSAALQAHRLCALERRALVRAGADARALHRRAGRRRDAPLLPAHQPLQRVVRVDHGRRDADARRRAQAPRADLGAPRRRAELSLSRVDGAQALPGPGLAGRGSAARRVGVPQPALQDAGAIARLDAQLPEPLGRGPVEDRDLPARPHVFARRPTSSARRSSSS